MVNIPDIEIEFPVSTEFIAPLICPALLGIRANLNRVKAAMHEKTVWSVRVGMGGVHPVGAGARSARCVLCD
jgi:hypothetical protein